MIVTEAPPRHVGLTALASLSSWVSMPLMLVGLVAVVVIAIVVLLWGRVWANRLRARILPAGIVGFAYSLPLVVVFLVGMLCAFAGALLVHTDGVIGVPATLLLGASGSLIATAIAAGFITARELTLARIRDSGLTYIWSNRKGRVPRDQQVLDWILELRKVKSRCVLLGTSLSGWTKDPQFAEVVRSMTSRVTFEILLLDPSSDASDMREREELKFRERTKLRIAESFVALVSLKNSLAAPAQENFRIYYYTAMPTFSLCWVDGYMIVTHYLPGLPNSDCPAYGLWDLHPFKPALEAQLYHVFADNVNFIRRDATLITKDNEAEKLRFAQQLVSDERERVGV